eukprot:g3675.t1
MTHLVGALTGRTRNQKYGTKVVVSAAMRCIQCAQFVCCECAVVVDDDDDDKVSDDVDASNQTPTRRIYECQEKRVGKFQVQCRACVAEDDIFRRLDDILRMLYSAYEKRTATHKTGIGEERAKDETDERAIRESLVSLFRRRFGVGDSSDSEVATKAYTKTDYRVMRDALLRREFGAASKQETARRSAPLPLLPSSSASMSSLIAAKSKEWNETMLENVFGRIHLKSFARTSKGNILGLALFDYRSKHFGDGCLPLVVYSLSAPFFSEVNVIDLRRLLCAESRDNQVLRLSLYSCNDDFETVSFNLIASKNEFARTFDDITSRKKTKAVEGSTTRSLSNYRCVNAESWAKEIEGAVKRHFSRMVSTNTTIGAHFVGIFAPDATTTSSSSTSSIYSAAASLGRHDVVAKNLFSVSDRTANKDDRWRLGVVAVTPSRWRLSADVPSGLRCVLLKHIESYAFHERATAKSGCYDDLGTADLVVKLTNDRFVVRIASSQVTEWRNLLDERLKRSQGVSLPSESVLFRNASNREWSNVTISMTPTKLNFRGEKQETMSASLVGEFDLHTLRDVCVTNASEGTWSFTSTCRKSSTKDSCTKTIEYESSTTYYVRHVCGDEHMSVKTISKNRRDKMANWVARIGSVVGRLQLLRGARCAVTAETSSSINSKVNCAEDSSSDEKNDVKVGDEDFIYFVLNFVRDQTRHLLVCGIDDAHDEGGKDYTLTKTDAPRTDSSRCQDSTSPRSACSGSGGGTVRGGKSIAKAKRRITITRVATATTKFTRNPAFAEDSIEATSIDRNKIQGNLTRCRVVSGDEKLVARNLDTSGKIAIPERSLEGSSAHCRRIPGMDGGSRQYTNSDSFCIAVGNKSATTNDKTFSRSKSFDDQKRYQSDEKEDCEGVQKRPRHFEEGRRLRARRLATLYSAILLTRSAPNLLIELHLIVRLLTAKSLPVGQVRNGAMRHPETQQHACVFMTREDCARFGALVVAMIHSILVGLGKRFVHKFVRILESVHSSVSAADSQALRNMRKVLTRSNNATTPVSPVRGGIINDDDRDDDATGIGFALPFRPDTDSRLHFRTRHQVALYQNREQTRDAFLEMLRQYRDVANDLNGSLHDNFEARLRFRARQCLDAVVPANYNWFSELFLSELLQVTRADEEPDQHVRVLLEKMPGSAVASGNLDKKLRDLHKRLHDKRPLSSPMLKRTSSSTRVERSRSRDADFDGSFPPSRAVVASLSSRDESRNRHRPQNGTAAIPSKSLPPTASAAAASQFRGMERFFFLFLLHCDSHALSSQLIRGLASRIRHYSSLSSQQMVSSPNLAKWLPRRLNSLKLLGRFLGLVLFSPNWATTSDPSYANVAEMSTALSKALRDDIHRADQLAPPIDAVVELRDGKRRGQLTLVVPWVSQLLRMAFMDRVSMGTSYTTRVIDELRSIRANPIHRAGLPGCLSSSAFYVLAEIEMLFEKLRRYDDVKRHVSSNAAAVAARPSDEGESVRAD